MTTVGQQIIAEIRRIAAENPDFIYAVPEDTGGSCVYIHQGQPSCIVGRALWNLGYIGPSLEYHETRLYGVYRAGRATVNASLARELFAHLGISLDTHEVEWIRAVQFTQDNKRSWGKAIAHADSVAMIIPA